MIKPFAINTNSTLPVQFAKHDLEAMSKELRRPPCLMPFPINIRLANSIIPVEQPY